MPDSEAKKKWKAENTKNLVVNINRNTDPEIFEWLSTLKGAYGKHVKRAIKEYIANRKELEAESNNDDDGWDIG